MIHAWQAPPVGQYLCGLWVHGSIIVERWIFKYNPSWDSLPVQLFEGIHSTLMTASQPKTCLWIEFLSQVRCVGAGITIKVFVFL